MTAAHCPHCPTIKRIFDELAQHTPMQLSIFDIAQEPEKAAQFNIRSVPWFQIEDLPFQGLHSPAEIAYWLEHAQSETGIRRYVTEQLNEGQLSQIVALIRQHPDWLIKIIPLLADLEAPMQARIGLSVLLETLQGEPILENILPALLDYSRHTDHRIRGDACHYLGLINHPQSEARLRACVADSHPEVQEIAADSLQNLAELMVP